MAKCKNTGYECLRYSLCISNILFWLAGCVLLGLGIWFNVSMDSYARVLPSYHLLSADNLMITCGALTFLISFCGCCGAWFKNRCVLGCYLTVIILVMALQVLAGTLGFFYREQIRETLKEELLSGITSKYSVNDTGLAKTWDHFQENLDCCGVVSYADWYKIGAWPEEDWVPLSCCLPLITNETAIKADSKATTTTTPVPEDEICGRDEKRDKERYRKSGCYPKIRNWLLENLYIVGITCIVFAFIQFFSILSSLILICSLENNRKHLRGNGRSTYNRVPTL